MVIREELELESMEDIFSEFDETPTDSGCLAQVYKAKLVSGETVAVKVQHPNALAELALDLYILRRAAEVLNALSDRFE